MPFNEILLFLANNDFTYKYILLFYILSLVCIALPIPYTFVIISNAYVFGWIGFFSSSFCYPAGIINNIFTCKKVLFYNRKIKTG